jgi:uncharacterized Fe-S center protein
MVETVAGIAGQKEGRVAYFNFLLDITPDCDCFPWSDTAVVPDIGILGSTDPIAIDQASVDLINRAPGIPGSALATGLKPGDDKFKALYPAIDWARQLAYGQEIGLGSREYELVELGEEIG